MLWIGVLLLLSGFAHSQDYQTCHSTKFMTPTSCPSSNSTCVFCYAQYCLNTTYYDFQNSYETVKALLGDGLIEKGELEYLNGKSCRLPGRQLYGYACFNDSTAPQAVVLGPSWSNKCWRAPSGYGDSASYCSCTGHSCNGASSHYTPPRHETQPITGHEKQVTCYDNSAANTTAVPCSGDNHADCKTCTGHYCYYVVITQSDPKSNAYQQGCVDWNVTRLAPFQNGCFSAPWALASYMMGEEQIIAKSTDSTRSGFVTYCFCNYTDESVALTCYKSVNFSRYLKEQCTWINCYIRDDCDTCLKFVFAATLSNGTIITAYSADCATFEIEKDTPCRFYDYGHEYLHFVEDSINDTEAKLKQTQCPCHTDYCNTAPAFRDLSMLNLKKLTIIALCLVYS